MKNIVKNTSIILSVFVAVFLFSLNAGCYADEKENNLRMTYIDSFSGAIQKGLASTTVKVDVTGTLSVTNIKIKMELQKSSGGVFTTIETSY